MFRCVSRCWSGYWGTTANSWSGSTMLRWTKLKGGEGLLGIVAMGIAAITCSEKTAIIAMPILGAWGVCSLITMQYRGACYQIKAMRERFLREEENSETIRTLSEEVRLPVEEVRSSSRTSERAQSSEVELSNLVQTQTA